MKQFNRFYSFLKKRRILIITKTWRSWGTCTRVFRDHDCPRWHRISWNKELFYSEKEHVHRNFIAWTLGKFFPLLGVTNWLLSEILSKSLQQRSGLTMSTMMKQRFETEPIRSIESLFTSLKIINIDQRNCRPSFLVKNKYDSMFRMQMKRHISPGNIQAVVRQIELWRPDLMKVAVRLFPLLVNLLT